MGIVAYMALGLLVADRARILGIEYEMAVSTLDPARRGEYGHRMEPGRVGEIGAERDAILGIVRIVALGLLVADRARILGIEYEMAVSTLDPARRFKPGYRR